MFKKISIPLLLFFVSACVFNSTEIGRTKEKFSDFFLCFPETDIAFNRLSFEEQVLIRKKSVGNPLCGGCIAVVVAIKLNSIFLNY